MTASRWSVSYQIDNEFTHHRHYRTWAEAWRDLFEYIGAFNNRRRMQSVLGYRPPAELEAFGKSIKLAVNFLANP